MSPESRAACLNDQVRREEREQKGAQGLREGAISDRGKTYVHGNVPGHVDVGFVLIHPHLGGPQGVALSVVIYVVVVGLLGALDVGHSGTWQDFHTPSTLPHLKQTAAGNRVHVSIKCGFTWECFYFFKYINIIRMKDALFPL